MTENAWSENATYEKDGPIRCENARPENMEKHENMWKKFSHCTSAVLSHYLSHYLGKLTEE